MRVTKGPPLLCRLVQHLRGALPELGVADLPGRLVAYSAASPMVRIVLPLGIVIGSWKRRDQFIM
jgi:hypothetical protein